MPDQLEQLLDSLLYEGYALYPYTPTTTKNSTPTPFGIAYPTRYAAGLASTFDHVEMRCTLLAEHAARISADVRFLAATGERHQALAHRLALPEIGAWELLAATEGKDQRPRLHADVEAAGGSLLRVAMTLSAYQLEDGALELVLRIENRTTCADGLDRAQALRRALISTHPLVRVHGGRFLSPLERPSASVNTFPVLATDSDDAMLGAAIVLPDHPRIAPESRGGMFDSTEIEEALLLHVQTLSDEERKQIAHDDPRVREMIERAVAVTPKDVLALHGRLTLRDPLPGDEPTLGRDRFSAGIPRERPLERDRFTASPPREPAGLLDPRAGEAEAEVDGVCFRRGGKIRLRPGEDADLHAQMLGGRLATIERILIDCDGKTHLGVTVDDDPGQDLLRDSGRLLFFFPPEVEVLQISGEHESEYEH
jgi:hypothetical protein